MAVACYEALSQGESFSAGLEEWVPSSEIALIAAGEVSGELERCLKDAVKLIEGVMQIRKAVIGATIYPTVLIIMLSCLLHIIADSLVPKLAAVTSPETWEGAAYILYIIAEITTNYGIYILVGVVGSIVAILFSFRFLNGNIRVFLDKIPPWSVYRAVHGCIFC
uniref:type II secretion system F family protein n=1 Tax=Salmonella enterica TaxID=28901 RepID=UPI00155DC39D|nr:type II secretion system F family protein [Salmonella enterica]